MGASCSGRRFRSREVAGLASRLRRLGAACRAAQTHTRSQDIWIQAHYHIGAARRTCSIARPCDTHAASPQDGESNRAEAVGICRRASEARERSNRLGGGARGRRARWFLPVDRMRLRRTAHTQPRHLHAAQPARISSARKIVASVRTWALRTATIANPGQRAPFPTSNPARI